MKDDQISVLINGGVIVSGYAVIISSSESPLCRIDAFKVLIKLSSQENNVCNVDGFTSAIC